MISFMSALNYFVIERIITAFTVNQQSRPHKSENFCLLNKNIYMYFFNFYFSSQVTLIPEEAEDMWHTYNLLQVGDSLRASTIRSVPFCNILTNNFFQFCFITLIWDFSTPWNNLMSQTGKCRQSPPQAVWAVHVCAPHWLYVWRR